MFVKKEYYAYNNSSIIINKKCYKKIKKYIKTAIVTEEFGYINISLNCHERYHGIVGKIVNYEKADEEKMCQNCALRLEKILGDCRQNFRPLRDENNLNYLIKMLHRKRFKENKEIREIIRSRWEYGYDPMFEKSTIYLILFIVGIMFFSSFLLIKEFFFKLFKIKKGSHR